MRRLNRFLNLAFGFSVSLGSVGACSSEEEGPGPTILDDGGDGDGGEDGPRFGNDSGSSLGSAIVGRRCEEDLDCPAGLSCLTQEGDDLFGGGPSNGYCSLPCTRNTECGALDASSVCVILDDAGTPRDDTDDTGYCLQSCEIGGDPNKCQGRADVACFPLSQTTFEGACLPTCQSDEACGDRVCHFVLGVCVDPEEVEGTLPIGAACDPDADDCQGFCLGYEEGYSACSGYCVIGEAGCGAQSGMTSLDTFCLFGLTGVDGVGDAGYCGQLCDCNGDCGNPDFICSEVGGMFSQSTGRAGFCVPGTATDGGIPDPGILCTGGEDAAPPPPPDGGTSDAGPSGDAGADGG